MSAIFLPRKWRRQPQGAVEIDQNHPIGRKVLWAYTPWMGLTSITPGTVRGITASPNNATVVTKAGRNGAGVEVRSTGSYSGVGLNIANTETMAGFSASGAFYFLVDGLRYANSNTCGLVRLQSPSRLRVTSDSSGRKLEFYISSGARLTGSVSIPDGYTGGIGISAETRSAVSTYIGQQIGIDRGSLGTFNLGGPDGIRSVTDGYPNWICPLFVRTDYLSHDEMRALDEAPFTVFRAPSHRIWFDAGAGAPAAIEGDVVAEESGADTLAATGSVVVAGSLAAAETSADTFAATGGAVATGTLAAGEAGADALVGTGKVLVAGGLAAAEAGADNAAATGAVLVAGSLAATETAHDTFSASGAGLVAGTLAAVESGADTITVAGKVVVSGALSAAEVGADTAQATGAVRVSGALSASETGTDTFSSTGEQPRITGEFAASEIGTDGFAAVGIVPAIGSFDLLEAGHDSLTGAGQIIVAGVLGAVESGVDSFYATPAGAIVGVMAAVEAADAFSARGHGRSAHGARMSTDRGYQSMTTRRQRQRG